MVKIYYLFMILHDYLRLCIFFDSYCFSGHRKNQSCKFFVRTHSRLITNLLCISPPFQGLMKIHKGISIISSLKINPEMRLMHPKNNENKKTCQSKAILHGSYELNRCLCLLRTGKLYVFIAD